MASKKGHLKELRSALSAEWQDLTHHHSPLIAALENPDLLSDEHRVPETYDADDEETRRRYMVLIRWALRKLSAREKEVAELLQRGYTQESIAKQLGVSRLRVRRCIQSIRKKLKRPRAISEQSGVLSEEE